MSDVWDFHLLRLGDASGTVGLCDVCINIIHGDRAHKGVRSLPLGRDGSVALHQTAVDAQVLHLYGALCYLIRTGTCHHEYVVAVFYSHLPHFPAENGLIEFLGALHILRVYLEMYDSVHTK